MELGSFVYQGREGIVRLLEKKGRFGIIRERIHIARRRIALC